MSTIDSKLPPRWDQEAWQHLGRTGHTRPPGGGVRHSTLFDQARFASIQQDGQGGLTAHLGLGVDVAGTLRVDSSGQVTFEQHVLQLQPGQAHTLSAADKASLVSSLQRYVGAAGGQADPLWTELLHQLK